MKIFDTHFHVFDPRFRLLSNDGYRPDPFTVADYLDLAAPLGVVGGAVVSASFQGDEPPYLVDALGALGPAYVGVIRLPRGADEDLIRRLDAAGVRAVRQNVRRHGSRVLNDLRETASRIWDLARWHVELYVPGRKLDELAPTIALLPRVVVDHLGLHRGGLPALMGLVEAGVYVKASGFGRLDFDPAPVLRQITDINPDVLVFGTDLPSTRARRPFRPDDITMLIDTLGARLAEKVLYDNAVALYRPSKHVSTG